MDHFQRRGVELDIGGHSYAYFIRPKEFFKRKPQWYALHEDKRDPEYEFCLSQPDLVNTLLDRVEEYYKKHPEISRLTIHGNDSKFVCQCDKCRDRNPDEMMFGFHQRLRERFSKSCPQVTVQSHAYNAALQS
ncbi:MAG: DUF4838 domain-containing protein [Planctomycetota bacterium]|nr:DUF4838 domain-containing protein [Planctomycetota bacterium]